MVVLDISDRSDPQEIRRLPGVLPTVSRPALTGSKIPDRPPTFDEYRAIRRGKLYFSQCGHPPTVSTHAGQHCRPDGSCYRQVQQSEPTEEGSCERGTVQAGRPGGMGRAGRTAPRPRPRAQRAAPAPTEMGAAEMEDVMAVDEMGAGAPQPDAPRGGEGGAGSLSQMMVHESTLFVLSADENLDRGWLSSFDISDPTHPRLSHVIGLDNGPEALQIHDNLLLIAGRDALVTASVASSDGPRLLGERRQNCPVNFDPVVVEGSIAYRTIIVDQRRSRCRSRLEVIDLSQPHRPNLRTAEAIDRPRSLVVLGDRLFVADERRGVRVFDLTDPVAPSHTTTWQLPGVKDLVISDFDLYAMTPDKIETFYIAPLYGSYPSEDDSAIYGQPTIARDR